MGSSQSNRGKELEKRLNAVNLYYRKTKLAVIHNLPLPVAVTAQGIIPISTPTDYIGCMSPVGRGVAFDAKETKSKTSFPLANIHDHQLNFLTYFEETGGYAGFLIWFKTIDDHAYWVPPTYIKGFIEAGTRKSIPRNDFVERWKVNIDDYLGLKE